MSESFELVDAFQPSGNLSYVLTNYTPRGTDGEFNDNGIMNYQTNRETVKYYETLRNIEPDTVVPKGMEGSEGSEGFEQSKKYSKKCIKVVATWDNK